MLRSRPTSKSVALFALNYDAEAIGALGRALPQDWLLALRVQSSPCGLGRRPSRPRGWQVAASLPGANVNLLHDPSLTHTFTGNGADNNT